MEISGRGLMYGALPTFAWRGWQKEKTVEVSTACVQAQVRNSLLSLDDTGSQAIPV
jgi:hypothetical protein